MEPKTPSSQTPADRTVVVWHKKLLCKPELPVLVDVYDHERLLNEGRYVAITAERTG